MPESSHACELSPVDYWALRDDHAFDEYVAAADGSAWLTGSNRDSQTP